MPSFSQNEQCRSRYLLTFIGIERLLRIDFDLALAPVTYTNQALAGIRRKLAEFGSEALPALAAQLESCVVPRRIAPSGSISMATLSKYFRVHTALRNSPSCFAVDKSGPQCCEQPAPGANLAAQRRCYHIAHQDGVGRTGRPNQ